MKTIFQQMSFGLTLAFCLSAGAQIYDTNDVSVGTFAGSGFTGWWDGTGIQTMFNSPSLIVADSGGNLFVLDSGNFRIRKITPDATVSTFVGGGNDALPGSGTNVSLSSYVFSSMVIDHSNVVWLAVRDIRRKLIRIEADGMASEVVLDPPGTYPFCTVAGMCVDTLNNLYLSCNFFSPMKPTHNSQVVRYRTDGVLEVFAGYGIGTADGNGLAASFSGAGCLATDAADNVYVWDADTVFSWSGDNHLIRRIDQNRNVVTLAGKTNTRTDADGFGVNASFNSIGAMCVDDYGNVFLACGSSIRKITATTNVVTLAGSFTEAAYTNGAGNLARFSGASGICLQSNRLFVADSTNHRIRQLDFTSAPSPATPPSLDLKILPGLKITGLVGRQYRIESSVDTGTWNVETSLTLSSSPFLWLDSNSPDRQKIYRAWLLP